MCMRSLHAHVCVCVSYIPRWDSIPGLRAQGSTFVIRNFNDLEPGSP